MRTEWWLLTGLLAGGLLLLRPYLRRPSFVIWTAGATLLLIAGAFGWQRYVQRTEASRQASRAKLPHAERSEYVSSVNCRSCHPDQYASWHRSFHRTMTQLPSPE